MNQGIDYGHGLWRIRPGDVSWMLWGQPTLFGVSGATGSFVYYIPDEDAVITGTFNQTEYAEKHIEFILSEVLPTLARAR